MPVDLSVAAVAERRQQRALTNTDGLTGRDLTLKADAVFKVSHKAKRVAEKRRPGPRRDRALKIAKNALLTASLQIRIAARIPPDTLHTHALTFRQLRQLEDHVQKRVCDDTPEQWAQLAVDTARIIEAQIQKLRQI